MEYVLSKKGRPFSDPDAAAMKARILSDEVGERFHVIDHPEGGYAVVVNRTVPGNGDQAVGPAPAPTSAPGNGGHDMNPWEGMAAPQQPTEGLTLRTNIPKARISGGQEAENRPGAEAIEPKTGRLRNRSFHPAWRSFWLHQGVFMIGTAAAFAPAWFLGSVLQVGTENVAAITRFGTLPMVSLLGAITAVTAAAYMLYGYYANRYKIGDFVVESHFGIIARKTARVEYSAIREVEVKQGVIDRLLNVGRLEISTAATEGAEVLFAGVIDPMAIQDEITTRKRRLDSHRRRAHDHHDD